MANKFLKPQKPIQNKDDDYIYPLTVAGQVITDTENNTRLDELLGNESIELLWRNSNLTVAFPPQTIPLDLRDYKAIIIKVTAHRYVDNTVHPLTTTHILEVNGDGEHLMSPGWGNYFRFMKAEDTGLIVHAGYYYNGYNNNSWTYAEQCAIPKEIWGIKKSTGKKYKVIENAQNYSTEEQIIGTWIDGKPLYRNYREFDFPTNAGIDVRHNVPNVDTMWIDFGMSFCIGTWGVRQPWNVTTAYCDSSYFHWNAAHPNGRAHLVIYYTKTTD